jgi:hypothetical protein
MECDLSQLVVAANAPQESAAKLRAVAIRKIFFTVKLQTD